MDVNQFQPYKLLFHQSRLQALAKGEPVYPVSVEIDLSNACPHDCPFCSFGTSASNGYRQQNWVTFPYPRILDLLTELKNCSVESVTFTGGGEPLVHRQAAEILDQASHVGLQWGLVTNGLLLKGPIARLVQEGATFVRISLDAGTDETHMVTHGVKVPQLSQILDNIRRLKQSDRKVVVGASFCVMDSNVDEIQLAATRVQEAGGDYLEVRPTYPTDWRGDGWANGLTGPNMDRALYNTAAARAHFANSAFRVIGLTERFDSLTTPAKRYQRCQIGPLTTVIGADGRLWHCCVQRGQPFFELGSVANRPFKEVWAEVLKVNRAEKIDVSQCPRCRYDGYNELIERACQSDQMHRSFV